jgi:hypothetical protein
MIRCLTIAVVAVALLGGCKESRECERARMDLSKTWHSLAEAAHRRQLAGVDIEGWKFIETKVQLLESSFMTTQTTWDSADKARGELAARIPSVSTDTEANMTGFRLSFDAALKQQDAYAKQCR